MLVMRANGSDVRVVSAPRGAEDFDPIWSKTGRLAFIRQRAAKAVLATFTRSSRSTGQEPTSGHRSLLTLRVPLAGLVAGRSNAGVHRPVRRSQFRVRGRPLCRRARSRPAALPAEGGGDGRIGWSPNGTTIVLAASVPGAEPYDPYRLFTIRISDRRIVQLTRLPFARRSTGNHVGHRTASRSCSPAQARGALRSTRSGPTGVASDSSPVMLAAPPGRETAVALRSSTVSPVRDVG